MYVHIPEFGLGSAKVLDKAQGGVLTLLNLASSQELSIAAPAASALASLASQHGMTIHTTDLVRVLSVKAMRLG